MSYVPVLDLGYADQDIRYAKGNDRTFTVLFTNKTTGLPVDLTGYTFTSGVDSPSVSFSVSNSAPTTGQITVTITSAMTTALLVAQRYTWFLKYVYSSSHKTILAGRFMVV